MSTCVAANLETKGAVVRNAFPSGLWLATLAATLLPVSLIWDYSWESTVGVDRVWAPPHLATHIGVWICAMVGAQNLFSSTRTRTLNSTAIGTLRASPGAWIMLWGVLAFETAFLFDTWWQQAYGLGAGIWHPPQILKAASVVALQLGAVVLCASAPSDGAARPQRCLIWNTGMLLVLIGVMMGTTTLANAQHAATFYKLSSVGFPVVLMIAAIAPGLCWGATRAALAYLVVGSLLVWVLPLVPARPLTGPIYTPMDRLMPPIFPLLLVIPAAALDLAVRRLNSTCDGRKCFACVSIVGVLFFALFAPTQWWFSKFLLSPMADNWFFAGGGRHWPFFLKIDEARLKFWRVEQGPLDLGAIMICLALAVVSVFVGVRLGRWLFKLQR